MTSKGMITDNQTNGASRGGWGTRLSGILLTYNTLVIFVALLVVSSLASGNFFTERNLSNLLRQSAGIGIVSMGMLLVILTGGIDLSVGSVAAFASVVSAQLLLSMSLPVAVFLTILAGTALGCTSGLLVVNRRMAPFVVTLAMMTIARGWAYIISKGSPIILEASGQVLRDFASGNWLHVPFPVWLMVVIFAVILFILRRTAFGRLIIAIGSNETAVRLSGIRVGLYTFAVYAISSGLASLAGIISTARTGVGSPIVGSGLELDAIAAVVIGGARLAGGKGTAFNTLLGICILGMIGNIMNLRDVPAYPQQVIKGVIILFAVSLQGIGRRNNHTM